jgi:fumarate hydratase class II
MPGKTNPVTVEAAMLASAQIVGLDAANSYANLFGELLRKQLMSSSQQVLGFQGESYGLWG